MPNRIKLKPEHASKLNAMMAQEKGMQSFVQQVIDNGQRRSAELEQRRIEFYTNTIANDADYKAQGLDLKAISYVPSPDGTELVPAMQRFEQ
jgi:hypothetical protein